MKKKTKTNNVRKEAKFFLKEENYYLLSDLPQILGITEKDANDLKGFIMKEYWLGNLKHGICSFHGQYPISFNVIGIEDKVLFEREMFRSLLLPVNYGHWDRIKINVLVDVEDNHQKVKTLEKEVYILLAKKPWEFYIALINEELENKRVYESQNKPKIYTSLVLLYLPNLAIYIKDLKSVLKKKRLTELSRFLPKSQKRKQSDIVNVM